MEVFLYIALGLFVGVVAALKVIAPKTKNTTDDKVRDVLVEKVQPIVDLVVKTPK